MSRVDAVRIAVEKAREFRPDELPARPSPRMRTSPSPTVPELALEAGVSAIIQPGGSVRDGLTVTAADEAGAAMVATGVRHFRH